MLAAWRSRYVPVDSVDLEARAMLNKEAAAIRAEGNQPNALTVWVRLCDMVVRVGSPSSELIAATTLAGLAAGVRPQGFNALATATPDISEAE